jgi:hypothetical protein
VPAKGGRTLIKRSEDLSVFDTISRWLPRRNPDSDYWWGLTGPQMAAMFEEAGYSKELQFENLLIHYYWTVRRPSLFLSPSNSSTQLDASI